MIERSDIVEIGTFNKPHGVCGEVSATIPLVDFHVDDDDCCIVVNIDNIYVPFFVSACRRKSSETYLLTIDGIGDDTEASMLNNRTIYMMRKDYEKHVQEFDGDELPIGYFVGFEVTDNASGQRIGEIVDIDDSTANVLFVVKGDNGSTCLIPAVEDFIDDIDTDQRIVRMTLPAGMLNL